MRRRKNNRFPPISFYFVACRRRLYLSRLWLTHRWTGLWEGFPAGPPERKACGWTRPQPGQRFGGKRTKWTKWQNGHEQKDRDRVKDKRTRWICDEAVHYLPFEGHSWWALGSECQWRHLVVGDNLVKFLLLQVSWGTWLVVSCDNHAKQREAGDQPTPRDQ